MCHPCWRNIKRMHLNRYARVQVGQTFSIGAYPLESSPEAKATVLVRHEDKNGVILVIQIKNKDPITRQYWDGVRVLWCPKWGGGGWVDHLKADPEVMALLAQGEQMYQQAEQEQEAANCMAL